MCEKIDCDQFRVGTVTVLTVDKLVFTGQLIRGTESSHSTETDNEIEEEFITLTLTAPVLKVSVSGRTARIQTFYTVGDTINIIENNIVSVGPSHV